MHSFIGEQYARRSSGSQLSTGGRPRKTPLFDYSSARWQRRNRRDRHWAEMISARPSKGQGAGRRAEKGGEKRSERKRKRGRGAKNEVKFIRVQTDVNLFKLCDFGSGRGAMGLGVDRRKGAGERRGRMGRWGFIAARRERLYLLYHCAGQGMGVEREGLHFAGN